MTDRERLKAVFPDTKERCRTDPRLAERLRSCFYESCCIEAPGEDPAPLGLRPAQTQTLFTSALHPLAEARTLSEVAAPSRVAVVNVPGSGSLWKPCAAHAWLMVCTTYMRVMRIAKLADVWYPRAVLGRGSPVSRLFVWTPGITVFKTLEDRPQPLEESKWLQIDVLTAMPPVLPEEADGAEIEAPSEAAVQAIRRSVTGWWRSVLRACHGQGSQAVVLPALTPCKNPYAVAAFGACKDALSDLELSFDKLVCSLWQGDGDQHLRETHRF